MGCRGLLFFTLCVVYSSTFAFHDKGNSRPEVPPDNPHQAAVVWAIDDAREFKNVPKFTRELFCTKTDELRGNPKCAIPVPAENYFALGAKAELEGNASFGEAIEKALEKLTKSGGPTLNLYLTSHGTSGAVCRKKDQPWLAHKDIVKTIFTRVAAFEQKHRVKLSTKIFYDSCYSATFAKSLEDALEDPNGEFSGYRGKKFKHQVDLYTSSQKANVAVEEDFLTNLQRLREEYANSQSHTSTFDFSDDVAICSKGCPESGGFHTWSSHRDLAKAALQELKFPRDNKVTIRYGSANDFLGTPLSRDSRLDRPHQLTALRILRENRDSKEVCEISNTLLEQIKEPANAERYCWRSVTETFPSLEEMSKILYDGKECKWNDVTLEERILQLTKADNSSTCMKNIAIHFATLYGKEAFQKSKLSYFGSKFVDVPGLTGISAKLLMHEKDPADWILGNLQMNDLTPRGKIQLFEHPEIALALKGSTKQFELFRELEKQWPYIEKNFGANDFWLLQRYVTAMQIFARTPEQEQRAREMKEKGKALFLLHHKNPLESPHQGFWHPTPNK